MGQAKVDTLESALGYRFARRELLELALTHSSVAYERNLQKGEGESKASPQSDNEQLEFLGDAVLGLIVAESLYERFPELREGDLTRLRASLVSRKHLGEVAGRIHLGNYLRLGKGEDRSGGRRKSALLANAIEAVFAAVYLDGGLEAVRTVVETCVVQPSLAELELALQDGKAMGDHKSALQEYLQATNIGQPRYVVTAESGPDHRKRFCVEARILQKNGSTLALARAEGSTKKQAQQEAARIAHERLIREKLLPIGDTTGHADAEAAHAVDVVDVVKE
ncbi:MAG: ribonuclease III [Acidobacteriaceae bacterium]